MLDTIKLQTKQAAGELLKVAKLKPGQILVAGCSSSEVGSFRIGSHSSQEIGAAILRLSGRSWPPGEYIWQLSAVST